MNTTLSTLRLKVFGLLDKYSILVAAVVIYGYYLLTSIDLMEHSTTKRGFLSMVMQFDSLILMWIIAAVVLQLQKYRRDQKEQSVYRDTVNSEFERQKIHIQTLDDVTASLQEQINNPLAVISITSHTIRHKYETDAELLAWLDRIDSSLQRISGVINDVKAYQTQKIVHKAMHRSEPPKQVIVHQPEAVRLLS